MCISKYYLNLSLALLGLASGVIAQDPVPDYSRGFESFYALGLPDVKEAVYVRLDKQTARHGDVFRRYGNEGPDIGGTWLLKPLGEDSGEMLVGGINRLTVISKRQWKEEQEARMKAARAAQAESGAAVARIDHDEAQGNRRLPGSWGPADIKEDAQRLVTFLEAAETDGRRRSDSLQRHGGTLFLLAIHLHRSGATAEANRIAHLLFQKAGGQQAVISAALSELADAQYAGLYRDFIANRDWKVLHSGIDALAKRFARGWQRRDAVLQAAAMVGARLTAPPPPLQAEGLSETDQALAAELATVDTMPPHAANSLQRYSHALWILPNTTPRHGVPPGSTAETNILDRIKARGMESIPLLIALLDDTYPTALDNPNGNVHSFMQNTYYYSSSSSSSPQAQARMEAQRTKQFYESLPRPMTRGEIAVALLQQVVPVSRDSLVRRMSMQDDGDNRTDALRTAVTEWYEANKEKRAIDLALAYLENESEDGQFLQNTVMMYIAREGGTNELAIVERKLLESEPMQGSSLAMQYAQMRGEAARPFIEKYIARLKAPAADKPEDANIPSEAALFVSRGSGMGGNKEWTKRMIKQFETLLENASLADLLERLVSGEKKVNEAAQFLHRAASSEDPAKAVELLLDAAIRATDVTTSMTLIGMVQAIPYSRQSRMAFGGMPAAKPEKVVMPSPAEHRELWKKLLADNRTASEEEAAMWGADRGHYTIAAISAYAIEALSAADPDGRQMHHRGGMESYALLGARLIPLLIERATQLIEGKDAASLPPLPDAANVSKEARAALAAKLIAIESPVALREALDALGMDDYLAFMEDVADNAKLRDHLAPLANTITTVKIEIDDEAVKARFEALNGAPFSRKIGEQVLEAVRQLSPGGQPPIEAMAQRALGIKGYTILIRKVGKSKAGSLGYYMSHSQRGIKTPFVSGMLYGGDDHATGSWKIEPLATEKKEGEVAKPSAAESRKQKLLSMMAASGQEIPAEAIAMLEQMSDADLDDMDIEEDSMFDEDENTRFWEELDHVCGEKANVGSYVMLMFASFAPRTGAEGGNADDEDDEDDDDDDDDDLIDADIF
jgi:hypothetical protein